MRRGNAWRLGFILVLVVISGVLLSQTSLHLGLDLQGGVHVLLETDTESVDSEVMQRTQAIIERRVNGLGVTEPIIQRQGERRIIVELPGIQDQQQAIDTIGKTALLEFTDPNGNTVVTGAYLKNAQLGNDQFGRPAVDLEFNDQGAILFGQLTTNYVNQQSWIMLDEEVLQVVNIREPILGGKAQITGIGSYEEAKNLTIMLNAGALPVPLKVVQTRNVGPTLGQDSIDRSAKAGIIGIILVLLYMTFYYRLPGFIADISLGIYVVLVFAILTAINAVLTLPGIAGLILSIGMAVDANIIIFERIKEELNSDKRLRPAIESGFKRAYKTIIDANVTTLITAAVLFYFGSSIIKGFAVTLSIGILTSMFTALFATRLLLTLLVDRNPENMRRYFNMIGVRK